MNSPLSKLFRSGKSDDELDAVKRNGWQSQKILVISAEDKRLTWEEREMIQLLGERLYGKRKTS